MTKSPVDINASQRDTVATEAVHVTHVDVSADRTHISASFILGGTVDVRWEGAFTRAIEGKLLGVAKRWYIHDGTLILGEVQPGSALGLADAVSVGVDAANQMVATESADAAAESSARETLYRQTQTAAIEAERVLRAQLKL
jgi:hypothetical protein